MTDVDPQPSTLINNTKRNATRTSTMLWISITSIIVALIALIMACWSYTGYKAIKSNTHDADISHHAEQEALQSQLMQLQTNIITTQQNVTTLMRRMGNNQQQAAMSQIAYLINLANLQLNVSHDAHSALQLLSLAQVKLNSLNDPRFFALSNTLIKDIAKLKAVPTLNLTEIISRLDMLNDAIANATLLPNQKDLNNAITTSIAHDAEINNPQPSTWYSHLWRFIASIKHLIIIRKHDPNVQPVLDTQEQQLIKSMIQSKLLLAQYAATEHNNVLFQNDLGMVRQWIKKYFFESDNRNHLLKQLKIIQAYPVDLAIPNINDTLTILNQTLNEFVDPVAVPAASDIPSTHTIHQPLQAATPLQTAPAPKKKNTPNTTNATPANDNAGVAI